MKKILIGFTSFIFLLGGFAILIPFLIDINDYKPQLLAKAKEALGRDLKIDGNLQFRLLPQVKITLENVQLANADTGSQPIMASVEKVHLKLALWPLLKKKINIYKIEMIKPVVFFEQLSNGQGNWELPMLKSATSVSTKDDFKSNKLKAPKDEHLPESKDFDVNIHLLKITEGSFQYQDGKIVYTLDHITSDIQLASSQGPVRARGDLSYGLQPLNFNIELGKFEDRQPVKARFESDSCHLEIEGVRQRTNFQGHVKTDIDFVQFEKISGIRLALPSTMGTHAVMTSDVTTTEKNIKLDRLHIKANQLDAQGSFTIDHHPDVKIQGTLDNLPGGSHLTITSQAKGGSLNFQVVHMKQLMDFLQQDTTSMAKELSGKSHLKLDYKITPTAVYLNNLNFNLPSTVLDGELVFGINVPKPSLSLHLKTDNVVPILTLAGMSVHSNQKMSGVIRGKIEGNIDSFTFDTQTQIAYTAISAQGQGRKVNNQMEITSGIHLKSASFVTLMNQFGVHIPDMLNQIDMDADVTQKAAKVQLNTRVQAGALLLQTKGTVDIMHLSPQVNLDISIRHPNLKQLLGPLGTSTTAPTGDFSLEGHLEGSPATTLTMTVANGRLGSAGAVKGTIGYKGSSATTKPFLNVALSFPQIDLENLWAFTNYAVTTPAFSDPQIMLAAVKAPQKSPWSREKLDLQFLNDLEADIKIDAAQLKKEDLVFDDVSLAALIKQGVLRMDMVKAKFYGGQFDLTGQTDVKQNNASRYQFSLKGAELKNLSPKQGAFKITNGRVNLTGDLQTSGTSLYHLIKELQGQIIFHGKDGVVSGFNLQALTANLTKQNRLEGLSRLLQTSFKQGQTPFSSLDGGIDFQHGVGHLKDVKLVAQGAEGTVQGILDLPAYQMDITAQVVLTDLKNIPPFGIQLTGSLNAPVRSINSISLEKFMTRNVLNLVGDAVKSGKVKPKDLLNSFLGKGDANTSEDADHNSSPSSTPEAPSQAPSTPTSKPPLKDLAKNPEKALTGLLKGFL